MYRSQCRPCTGDASGKCRPCTGAKVSPIYRDSTLTCHFSGADDGIRTRDPHLGKVFRPNLFTCDYSHRRSELAVFDGPRLSAGDHYCQWRVVFPWCAEFRTTCTTCTATLRSKFNSGVPRCDRAGTSPSVAKRLSNSLTPSAPCRRRAVVGGVDQRSTACASPNHRRLPLGFGHLPSPSSVVRIYPQMRPVGRMRRSLRSILVPTLHSHW